MNRWWFIGFVTPEVYSVRATSQNGRYCSKPLLDDKQLYLNRHPDKMSSEFSVDNVFSQCYSYASSLNLDALIYESAGQRFTVEAGIRSFNIDITDMTVGSSCIGALAAMIINIVARYLAM